MKTYKLLILCVLFFNCSKDSKEDNQLSEQNRLALIGKWKTEYYTIDTSTDKRYLSACEAQFNELEFIDNEDNNFNETVGLQIISDCGPDVHSGSFTVNEEKLNLKTDSWPFTSGAYERRFNIVSVSANSLKLKFIRATDVSTAQASQRTFTYSKLD